MQTDRDAEVFLKFIPKRYALPSLQRQCNDLTHAVATPRSRDAKVGAWDRKQRNPPQVHLTLRTGSAEVVATHWPQAHEAEREGISGSQVERIEILTAGAGFLQSRMRGARRDTPPLGQPEGERIVTDPNGPYISRNPLI
jgi:hypothetical protein